MRDLVATIFIVAIFGFLFNPQYAGEFWGENIQKFRDGFQSKLAVEHPNP